MVGVSWHEALAFTRWLGERWAVGRLPAGCKVCLPSEAEWEKAARGGAQIPQQAVIVRVDAGLLPAPALALQKNAQPQRAYPWGKEITPERANYDQTGINATSAVGCFGGGASPYGVEEMSGNVWEWTRSHWQGYPYPADAEARARREDLTAGPDTIRVIRGNAYYANRTSVRCAYRLRNHPDYLDGNLGFRVVLSP